MTSYKLSFINTPDFTDNPDGSVSTSIRVVTFHCDYPLNRKNPIIISGKCKSCTFCGSATSKNKNESLVEAISNVFVYHRYDDMENHSYTTEDSISEPSLMDIMDFHEGGEYFKMVKTAFTMVKSSTSKSELQNRYTY